MINQRSRRKNIAIAQLFAVIGILIPMSVHPSTPFWLYAMHAVCGMLVGISIVISFTALRQKCSEGKVSYPVR